MRNMPLKSAVILLVNEIRENCIDEKYKNYMADLYHTIARDKRLNEDIYWRDIYSDIIGDKDDRTANEIISDTLKKHGIEIVKTAPIKAD
jgi:hypothetical protein